MNTFERSEILHSMHAFATRHGGVSKNDHTRSLNLAFGRGDSDGTVLRNLEIFASEVGFDPRCIVSLPQIHSDKIFSVGKGNYGEGYYIREGIESGDGYVTNEKGVALGIKTADCVPILFEAEKDGRIIAIGAVHAGWRGTVAMIAGKCVERLVSEFDANPSKIRVAIGPCIHSCCYEVSGDLYDAVRCALGEEAADRFVIPRAFIEGKYFCDLVGINRHILLNAGVHDENIDILNECTCCCHDKYFSHRYTSGNRGTMLSVIVMGG